jgi:hypothetical protein
MCAIVFGQIKLRYSQNISWFVLKSLILMVDVSTPLEIQMDVSVPPDLKWMIQYLRKYKWMFYHIMQYTTNALQNEKQISIFAVCMNFSNLYGILLVFNLRIC